MSASHRKLLSSSVSTFALVVALVLTVVLNGSLARAQAPNVVTDAQQVLGAGFNNPQSIAISSDGTVYVADTSNNLIQILQNSLPSVGTNVPVLMPSNITPALSAPQALAVDSSGNLYVGDTPAGGGRIVKLTVDSSGNATGSVLYAGSALVNPISLAIDSSNTLYIGDFDLNNNVGKVFTLAAGGNAPVLLNTGLPTTIAPSGLALDAASDLYILDNNATAGGLYKLKPGGTATAVSTGQFTTSFPSSVTLDVAGNIFVTAQLGGGNVPQVVEIPAASPATPYILPSTGIGSTSSIAFDPQGNLNIVDFAGGNVYQLAYRSPVNMGFESVGSVSTASVLFNIEFNIPRTLQGFRVVTQGDTSKELVKDSGTCTLGRHSTVGGRPITNYVPYQCSETYSGAASYPGIRSSALQVQGTGTTILASIFTYQIGFAGAEVAYPLTATTTVTGLKQPQALALSGLDKTLYIADTVSTGTGAQGVVYSTNGPGGTALTPVSTGRVPLLAPSALAVDGAGNLYIADFERGDVIKVPPAPTGQSATTINTGGLLQHPIALALDFLGNLYIGDAGPGGVAASTGNPGFVVAVPVAGLPFKVAIPGVPVVFPQALTTDPLTAALFIGDGGDASGTGQLVQLSPDLSTASIFPVNNVTNPTGLAFDAADDLYVLDGNLNTITVVAGGQVGNAQSLLPFNNTTLAAASALAISAGGQSFVIANIGAGSNNSLLYLNGYLSTLAYGNVTDGQSSTLSATVSNIGNLDLTLQSPYYTTGNNTAFSVLESSSTCGDGTVLGLYASCPINIKFSPRTVGPSAHYLVIRSDGYDTGKTTIAAQGTGVGSGHVKSNKK